jgi:plastocyanin
MRQGGAVRSALAGVLLAGGAPGAAAGEVSEVTMAGAQFSPPAISARVGDVIRFVNDDASEHNVFVPTIGHAVDLGVQDAGTTTELALSRPGRFDVECVIHAGMLTSVEVAP